MIPLEVRPQFWAEGDWFGSDQDTLDALNSSLGKVIKTVALTDDQLIFKFTDGTALVLYDDGQTCCETRYMATSDDFSEHKNSTLLDFELKKVPDVALYNQVQFLDVKTSKGTFQMASHNDHNGCYSGFSIVAHCLTTHKKAESQFTIYRGATT